MNPLRACILTIGNEILKGKTVNTNMAHIGRVLTFAGYEVYRSLVVRDDPEEIAWGIHTALSFSDLVVTSGGLGPTFDDMTIGSISRALGIETKVDEGALKKLQERYLSRGLELTDDRLKMVRLPVGSTALDNPVGAAPGVLLNAGGKNILILPGVPKEMEAILDSAVDLLKIPGREYYEETFPLEGIMESSFAPLISGVMKKWAGKVYIKSHPQRSETDNPSLEVEVSSSDTNLEAAKRNVKEAVRNLKENYPAFVGK